MLSDSRAVVPMSKAACVTMVAYCGLSAHHCLYGAPECSPDAYAFLITACPVPLGVLAGVVADSRWFRGPAKVLLPGAIDRMVRERGVLAGATSWPGLLWARWLVLISTSVGRAACRSLVVWALSLQFFAALGLDMTAGPAGPPA